MALSWRLILPVLMLLWWPGSAWADHMNGTYAGTGDAVGTVLALQQSGRMLNGQLTGETQGVLTGQTDGQDIATGTVTIQGGAPLQFQAQWSAAGLTVWLSGPGGQEEHFFAAGGTALTPNAPGPFGQPAPQPQPPVIQPGQPPVPPPTRAPPPPPPPVASVEYYLLENGAQIGPFSVEQIWERISQGILQASDLIWKTGLPDWVAADTLPELVQSAPPKSKGPPPPPGAQGSIDDLPAGVPNAGLSQEQRTQAAILLGTTLSVLSHELGHALIGEFGVASTGAEEDTADQFAALIMSSTTSDPEFDKMAPDAQALVTDMINYSSLLWFYDAQKIAQTGAGVPWYDEHSASETRFRNTLCMIYGSKPAVFKPLADRVGLPERERGRCEIDYQRGYKAWETIIAPYARNLGGDYPGQLPADAVGAKVVVSYQPSASESGRSFQATFEQLKLFEGLGEELEKLLVWKRDFQIIFADCGEPNAFYDPSEARIVMCWEGVEYFYWMIAEPEGFIKPAA